MKRMVVIMMAVGLVLGGLGMGCNTMRGFGRDVERAGERIQEGVRR